MLRIVGDINFTDGFFDTGFGVGTSVRKGKNPFMYLERRPEDFWIGNFECVCASTFNSNKTGLYRKQFVIPPEKLAHLKHLDLYGVANNHVMQHGHIAYREMLEYLARNRINYVGSKECKHIIIEHQKKKVGVLAFSMRPENFGCVPLYWSMPECVEVEDEIAKLSECEFKILYVHWGNEFINYPYEDQKQLAHFFIDKGIDLVIGMHPHVLQGYEVYKGKHIFYSLGNFVFNMAWKPTKYAVVVNVDLQEDFPRISWDYVQIGKDYFPQYIEENKVPDDFRFDYLNQLIQKTEENECYYSKVFMFMREYRKANYVDVLLNIPRFKSGDLWQILCDFVKRRLN